MKTIRKCIDRVADRYPVIPATAGILLAATPLWVSALSTAAAWVAVAIIFGALPLAYMLGNED